MISFHEAGTLASEVGLPLKHLEVQVRSSWQAGDPTDVFWFTGPDSALKDTLIVHRQDYITFIEPIIASKTDTLKAH